MDESKIKAMADLPAQPVCECPETDPIARSTRYTVAAFNVEPHMVGCPRHGIQRTETPR
jgi:hypothetical protein